MSAPQDQFEVVSSRVKQGKTFCKHVADFMSKRAALEKEYSKKLSSLCKTAEADFG